MTDGTTGAEPVALPLSGLVILDVSGSIATAYCGKLFAVGGAEVWDVEPASGFATRQLEPFLEGTDKQKESALHAWLSTGKQSIVIDAVDARWQALCAAADLVLTDGRPRLTGC